MQSVVYVVVKVTLAHGDNENPDDMADRVVSDCEYSFEYEDDIVEIVDTEIIDYTPDCPV